MSSEWNAAEYHRVSNPHVEWGESVLARVRALPPGNMRRVCDAGCGTGRITAELLKVLPPQCTVLALDASEEMLKTARSVLLPFSPRVEFARADFQRLPYENEFDLIFSTAAFHWAPDHDALFSSLYRALKPGGRLVAQCGGGANLARVRKREQQVIRSPRFAEYFTNWHAEWNYADAEATTRRMSNAGFAAIHAWLEEAPARMPDAANYRAFLETVVERTQLAYLPDEKTRSDYLDEMLRAANGDLEFDYVRLNIDASRP